VSYAIYSVKDAILFGQCVLDCMYFLLRYRCLEKRFRPPGYALSVIKYRGDNLRRPNAIPKGVGGTDWPIRIRRLPSPTPSHIPLTWHSGTEVVTSVSESLPRVGSRRSGWKLKSVVPNLATSRRILYACNEVSGIPLDMHMSVVASLVKILDTVPAIGGWRLTGRRPQPAPLVFSHGVKTHYRRQQDQLP
jgi:hypothetical protein